MLEAIDAGCHLVISENCDLSNILQHEPFVTVLSGDPDADQKTLLKAIDVVTTNQSHHINRNEFFKRFNNSLLLKSYEQIYHGDATCN